MNSVVDWLNGCLKNVQHEVFKDVVNISDGEVKPLDDGQVVIISDINRVTLTLETSDGEKRTLKAVAKFEPPPGAGRDVASDCGAFETETMMYTDVLKSMERLMTQVEDKDFLWPDCYYTSDNKLLLEDFGEKGYKVVPAYVFLDLDHSILVMKAIGKFHALSMVMEERGLLDKKKLKPWYYNRGHPFMIQFFKSSTDALASASKEWGPEWSSVPERLKKFMANPNETLQSISKAVDGKWDVLNHGDFSMRNILFHYKPGSKTPDDIKFVDFQMCNYGNHGLDLATLLYSSLWPQLREDNMSTLLNSYAESLAATCKQHGYKGTIPTADDVESSLRSLSPVTTSTSFCTIPFYIATEYDDMQKVAQDNLDVLNQENPSKPSSVNNSYSKFYSNKKIEDCMKFEVTRCIKENYI